MYKVNLRKTNIERRKLRVRKKITGTGATPRISVFRTNKHIYAQLIDDTKGHTIASVSVEIEKTAKGKTKTEIAFEAGKALAEKAKEKKVKEAVFDRNGFRFQGRVKALADGAREGGLKL
ncbi:MAG: 50S ribosomal protein L18 [candidate division WWE3 bacterium GW2011_GWF1_42_51]|uniref:Large ribosomal subunit protein uL18 n=3 Tax=Katanobacteria TaxID=422282 RepID=A0A1F4XG31_UNCKA|nr:MAG: 50S ribosomal protein L18 [candidate division WWE3 bacterium GW2011_GWE1_41_27]KKS59502.1 MAG: 50S ribosomal protein L18 [candidate division WWE3 bacterium GW2011_GWF2_42_42]KKS63384.1 MAG: 50S ribosomal protein L18 [candidate division WWE3 bacterium GW2011_GWF1_42_51]OGC80620.1 MAG: 50S ribosomal protein L18 [candidate division WWE3 bacterium RIFOXYD1_FULL_43_17]